MKYSLIQIRKNFKLWELSGYKNLHNFVVCSGKKQVYIKFSLSLAQYSDHFADHRVESVSNM